MRYKLAFALLRVSAASYRAFATGDQVIHRFDRNRFFDLLSLLGNLALPHLYPRFALYRCFDAFLFPKDSVF